MRFNAYPKAHNQIRYIARGSNTNDAIVTLKQQTVTDHGRGS
jgi:hypothetical protein